MIEDSDFNECSTLFEEINKIMIDCEIFMKKYKEKNIEINIKEIYELFNKLISIENEMTSFYKKNEDCIILELKEVKNKIIKWIYKISNIAIFFYEKKNIIYDDNCIKFLKKSIYTSIMKINEESISDGIIKL
jgi:hypothetical protein